MIDTWMSRRDHFIKCRYWCVDDDDIVPTDRVVHNNYPSGIFYAKEISPKSEENQIVESAFMVKKKSAILFTTDNVVDQERLKENDIVEYLGEYYRVDRISSEKIVKNQQFSKKISYKTQITLRG